MKSDYDTRLTKKKHLYLAFKELGTATTNEAIDLIYKTDLEKGKPYMLKMGWRYYVHLNKQTINLARDNKIICIGEKLGELGKKEKVWQVNL